MVGVTHPLIAWKEIWKEKGKVGKRERRGNGREREREKEKGKGEEENKR